MTHTPGPWNWEIHDSSMASLYGPEGMEQHVVSISPCKSCHDRAGDLWVWGRCQTPKLDDAILMAASPCLYEALKDMVHLFDGYQGMQLEKAKAALAKAEIGARPADQQIERQSQE